MTLSPRPFEEISPGVQSARAHALACVAGYVDAHALMRYHVYASFMTGNTTRTGVDAAAGQLSAAGLSLLAVVCFVVGAFAGVAMIYSRRRYAPQLPIAAALGLLIVYAGGEPLGASSWLSVALLSVSMGALNATITKIGSQPINIGYVTGELFKMAEHLALAWHRIPLEDAAGSRDTHLRRAMLITSVWSAFLVGAFAGASVEINWPSLVLYPPVVVLAAVLVASLLRRRLAPATARG